jgi:RNA polymerase sigma-70 factor, ECF subfamily
MEEPVSLSRIFLARRGALWADARSTASIESALRAMDTAARAAWPEIPLPAETFAAHVADRVRGRSDVADVIRTLHAADLFLACACSLGIATALAAFEHDHLSRVPGLVRRVDSSGAFADDVAQAMREMFLVPVQGRARIAEYSGRGPLSNWVRVIAVRTALRLRREQRRGVNVNFSDQPGELRLAAPADPELDYLKLRYRAA